MVNTNDRGDDANNATDPAPEKRKKVVTALIFRLLLACGLLLVEYLIISFFFDAAALLEVKSFGFVLGNLGYVAPVIVLAAAATIAFQGSKLKAAFESVANQFEAPGRVWPWLILQLLLFGGFFWLTRELFSAVETVQSPSIFWAFGWGIAALCVFLSTVPIALPIQTLGPLLRASASSLLVGGLGGLLSWFAGNASTHLWRYLGRTTLELVVDLLSYFNTGVQVDRAKLIVGIDPFYVVIDPVCSGFEGIGLITAFLGLYIFVYRRELKFPNVLMIIPIASLIVWGLNVVRIAVLIAIGRWISPEIALGGFHSKAGWVFFCAIALATVFAIQRSTLFSLKTADADTRACDETKTQNPTAALLVPLLAVIATSLVAGLFVTTGFDILYPLRVFAAAIALFIYRDYYRPLTWSWSWVGPAIGIVVFAIWISMVDAGDASVLHERLFALPTWLVIVWILFRVIGSSVTVPIVEELAFRGYLLRRLISKDFESVPKKSFKWIAFLLSSVAFGALHQQYLAGTVAGVFYAYAQYHRGRTTDAIVAHAVTNALIAAYVLFQGQWGLW